MPSLLRAAAGALCFAVSANAAFALDVHRHSDRKPVLFDAQSQRFCAQPCFAETATIETGSKSNVAFTSADLYGRITAERAGIIPPTADDPGTHSNHAGIALPGYAKTGHTKNSEAVIALVEFVATDKVQAAVATANSAFPALPSITPLDAVKSWRAHTLDAGPANNVDRLRKQAFALIDNAGFDAEPMN